MDRGKRPAMVTTSWDDGHPLDLRVAELLDKHGLRGTFYVPLNYAAFPRLTPSQMRAMQASGMEIGSHTVSHPRFTQLPDVDALRELKDSRDGLEQILGGRVRSFCFPEGKFSRGHLSLVKAAGYELARTTVAFRTELDFHPYAMPVTFQFWPHSRQILIRHALKEGNLSGLANWIRRWKGESDVFELSRQVMGYIETFGGILHIWGHSWEIESRGLWPILERTLAGCAHRPGINYVTNIDAVALNA
jgi:peptidoglycan/xylan/chitin deacetylase (PgdA/CDA1 family)